MCCFLLLLLNISFRISASKVWFTSAEDKFRFGVKKVTLPPLPSLLPDALSFPPFFSNFWAFTRLYFGGKSFHESAQGRKILWKEVTGGQRNNISFWFFWPVLLSHARSGMVRKISTSSTSQVRKIKLMEPQVEQGTRIRTATVRVLIGYFRWYLRVASSLCFKAWWNANPLIWTWIFIRMHIKRVHFHKKGFTLRFVLIVRVFGTRKCPIS